MQTDFANVDRLMTALSQQIGKRGRQRVVDERFIRRRLAERPFSDCFSREQERFTHVVSLEIRIQGQDLFCRLAFGDQRHNSGNGYPEPA